MAVELPGARTPPLQQDSRRGLSIAGLLAFGLAGATALAMRDSSLGASFAIVAFYAVVSAGLVSREKSKWGHRGYVSPLSICAVFWFAYNALPLPLAVLSSGTSGGAKASPFWLNSAALVSLGSLLLVAAGFAFGTKLFVGRSLRVPTITLQLAVLLASIGWGARLYLVAKGAYGYLGFGSEVRSGAVQAAIVIGTLLVPLSTAALGYLAWKTETISGPAGFLIPLAVVATALGALLSGMKAQIFTDLIPLFVIYIYHRRRLPWKAVLLIFVYIALIRLGVEEFRSDLASGRIEGSAGVGSSAEAVLERVNESAKEESFGQQLSNLVEHGADAYQQVPDNLALILSRTGREIPFLGVKRTLLEPIPVIPISVANDGPFSVTQYVNVVYRGGTRTSSSPAGQPGDLYMSAGWPAVFLGEILVGFVLGVLWCLVWCRNDPAITVLYSVLAVLFANAGIEYGLLLRGLSQRSVGLWTALMVIAFLSRNFLSGRRLHA